MPRAPTHVRVVREWLVSLGVLSVVSISRQEAEMKLGAFVPMLMGRFPDAAFTAASLEHVAAKARKGFPTYGELADWLGEWWRDNRPMPTGITGPDAQTPIQARELIAVNLRREWDDPAAIAAKVAAYADDPLLLRMLRGAVSKWAPQHAGLVPLPEPVAAEPDARMLWQLNLAGDADLPNPARPLAHCLTPAQLDEINPLPNGRKRTDADADSLIHGKPTSLPNGPDPRVAMPKPPSAWRGSDRLRPPAVAVTPPKSCPICARIRIWIGLGSRR